MRVLTKNVIIQKIIREVFRDIIGLDFLVTTFTSELLENIEEMLHIVSYWVINKWLHGQSHNN